nr:putative reverse transcriptase domain-containing protein [Tanacetum cinerariifolium]
DADIEEDDDAEIIFPYEFVGGLAPWALRRDLEALLKQERIREAESESSRTEIAFECKEKDRVKFAMATLRGWALTCWNGRTKAMGIKAANNTPWSEVKKW